MLSSALLRFSKLVGGARQSECGIVRMGLTASLFLALCGYARADEACPPYTAQTVAFFHMLDDGDGHIGVTAQIGGKSQLMIVDTGGATSTISSSVAHDLNLSIGGTLLGRDIDILGHATIGMVTVPSLVLGHARFNDVQLAVACADDPLIGKGNAQGLLAPDILASFDVDFDFRHGEMQFLDQNHCAGKIPYWAPMYASVPFDFDRNGHILAGMTLDGKPLSVTIDTGAPTSVMSLVTAARLFDLNAQSPGVAPVGSPAETPDQQSFTYRFKSLSVGGLEIRNPQVALVPDNFSRESHGRLKLPDLILGLRELARLHLYIAYREKTLYFTDVNAEYPNAEAIRKEVEDELAKAKAEGRLPQPGSITVQLNVITPSTVTTTPPSTSTSK
jgi:predicted aspartyl protease